MGHFQAAKDYFGHARRAGHDAGNPACAAYAAANTVLAALLRGDTPTALDMAAAARSLAARTHDLRLKALAEQMAAAAYALDGQYNPCAVACTRAHEFLASANGSVEAATNAHNRFNPAFVGSYARCQVRLGHTPADS